MAGILPEWFPGVLFLPCPVSFGVVDPEASREGVRQEEDKGVCSVFIKGTQAVSQEEENVEGGTVPGRDGTSGTPD